MSVYDVANKRGYFWFQRSTVLCTAQDWFLLAKRVSCYFSTSASLNRWTTPCRLAKRMVFAMVPRISLYRVCSDYCIEVKVMLIVQISEKQGGMRKGADLATRAGLYVFR